MASKSIIDRVLLLAAAVCAAGLIWQLTVLLTSKGRMPAAHGVDVASSAAAATGGSAPPAKPAVTPDTVEPAQAPVRVVYPDADTPKTTAKITESVPAATTTSPVASSATPAAATPDPSSNSQPTTGVIPVAMVAPISKPSAAPAPTEAGPAEAPVAASPASATPAPAPDEVASAEPAPQPDPATDPAAAAAPTPVASQAININNASVEALNHLRGGGHIGQAIAKHRPYRSVDDLMRKRVLRRDVFERIRGQIAAK
ncbi:MAG TPA: helix-hairpin-helix domain-containing protein [Lichenihabitans sp.]|jgi:hypothetical protein|nr:helix-hairpin-helix domain-containing protein [Lichenihabitans sp.]